MRMTIAEIITKLEQLKAEIEWEYSIEYQVVLDKVIALLRYVEKWTKHEN